MRAAYSMCGERRGLYRVLVGKETTWKTPAERGGSGMGVMDWIDLARYRYRWRALGNAIIILRVQ
jgi:hypothetical protein